MNKIQLPETPQENKVFSYGDIEIFVKSYLSLEEQINLINAYAEAYFNPVKEQKLISLSARDRFGAEYALKLGIVDAVTNIDISGFSKVGIYDNELWNAITEQIGNYYEFRELLRLSIEDISNELELNKSVGGVLDSLSDKLFSMLEELSNAIEKYSPEDLEKIKEVGSNLIKELKDSPLGTFAEDTEKSKEEK